MLDVMCVPYIVHRLEKRQEGSSEDGEERAKQVDSVTDGSAKHPTTAGKE
jgi:hypothetical protein